MNYSIDVLSNSLGTVLVTVRSCKIGLIGLTKGYAVCSVCATNQQQQQQMIERQSSNATYSRAQINESCIVVWNETLELHCNKYWVIQLTVTLDDSIHDIMYLHTDKFLVSSNIINNSSTNVIPVKQDNRICGEIEVSVEYFPNHQSFRCLVYDAIYKSPQGMLPQLLLQEMDEMLTLSTEKVDVIDTTSPSSTPLAATTSTVAKATDAFDNTMLVNLIPTESSKSLLEAVHVLISYASEEDMVQLLIEICKQSCGSIGEGKSYSDLNSDGEIDIFSALLVCKSFMQLKLSGLTNAPTLTYPLIEKQFSIYKSIVKECITATSTSASSTGSSNSECNDAVDADDSCIGNGNGDGEGDCDDYVDDRVAASNWNDSEKVTLRHLSQLCLLIGIWSIQHAFISTSLMNEFQISYTELEAIRARFIVYDIDLSGCISSIDLPLLLEDMSSQYSTSEIDMIVSLIDTDRLGIIEFTELIKWWTS